MHHDQAMTEPQTGAHEGDGGLSDPVPSSVAQSARHAFDQVPIEIVISVGRARPSVRDLLRLQRDSVLPLDRRIEDPVELFIGDRLIARGVLEECEGAQAGQMAVRLTEVADPGDRL
ncbi:MAG: flagellar motor switch protein FliN [Rhodobacteraceae bacterium HLUCCA12]|nr:MAG: flagellar motor switch protein FliN [Rhodobacteraceae bacterium HLUCCA12]